MRASRARASQQARFSSGDSPQPFVVVNGHPRVDRAVLAQPPSPSPRRSFGAFKVEETIGAGGMGVVYRARHRDTGRLVALKTVEAPQRQAAVQAEIRTLAGLRHPGIVAILDDGIEEGVPWYAMELLPGAPLSAFVERLWPPSSAPLPRDTPTVVMGSADAPDASAPAETARPRRPVAAETLPDVLRVMARLCRPLAYLHASGLVHRDLKPANVVLKPDGQVVLVDFGLASESAAARGGGTLDPVGAARGTGR
jgi:eukaryotic-like serine/threonine-protein kinase